MTIVRRAQAPRLGPLPSLGREAGARALTARVARRTRSITSNEIAKPPTKPPRPSSPRTTRRDLECTAPLPRAGGAGGGRRSHRNVSQHSLPIHPKEISKPPTKPPRPSKHCPPPACGRGRGRVAVPAQHLPAQPPNPPQRLPAQPPIHPNEIAKPRTNRRDLQSTAPLPRAGGAGGGRRSHRNVSQHSLPIHPNEITKPPTKPPRPSVHCSPPACGRGRGRAAVPRATSPSTASQSTPTRSRSPDQTAETFKALPPSRVREGPGEGGGPTQPLTQHSLPIHPNEIAKPQKNPMGFGS
jgi:hypothetical protein